MQKQVWIHQNAYSPGVMCSEYFCQTNCDLCGFPSVRDSIGITEGSSWSGRKRLSLE